MELYKSTLSDALVLWFFPRQAFTQSLGAHILSHWHCQHIKEKPGLYKVNISFPYILAHLKISFQFFVSVQT